MVVIWMHRLGDMYINVQNAYIGVLSALRRCRRCVLWTNIYCYMLYFGSPSYVCIRLCRISCCYFDTMALYTIVPV